ncbi:hypothetical protein QE152_g19064 [Popillia japonica]|uniref:Uncharacterized protein n=1 Tax=Popillia japonica TaxID=7064 RepID=A0AAW1L2F0_POPJA
MNKWLIKKRPQEDLNQNPGPSTAQSVSRPTNQQTKGQNKKLENQGNGSKNKRRKYNESYLKLGFRWTGSPDDPNPQCVVCSETL